MLHEPHFYVDDGASIFDALPKTIVNALLELRRKTFNGELDCDDDYPEWMDEYCEHNAL